MNTKRSQSEYELLFTKKNENGKLLNNSEIASILNVSRVSVWNARKKWLSKQEAKPEEYEVIENKQELKEITIPIDTFDNLINKALKSTNILKDTENNARINYFSTIKSLFNKMLARNKLREDIYLKLEKSEDTKSLEKELKFEEFRIKNEIDILKELKDYLFQSKLEFKKSK